MADEEQIEHRGGARIDTSPAEPVGHAELEWAIARLATAQHGRVSRAQLLALGVHRRSIARRIECGRLHVCVPGVYGVGHCALSREGRLMEGVLEMGEGGALSDLAAAAHWRLRPLGGGRLDVTVPRRRGPNPRLRIHRRQLAPDEVTVHDGIPTTTVARTLFDCARHLDDRQLVRAFNEAQVLELHEELSVPDLMERHPGYRGTVRLRRVIELLHSGEGVPQTDLEDLFVPFVEEFGLPIPEADVHIEIGGVVRQCDFAWRRSRVAVEMDSRRFHHTPLAFERDRSRDREFNAAGWRVVRVTWRHLQSERAELAADLQAMLEADYAAIGGALTGVPA